jgi:NDP-sugar pyrophosphorylase family protein
MKNLLIIGARGYGREVFNLATQCENFERDWLIKGFLDDKSDALDGFNYPVGIISSVEDYKIEENDVFICALGSVFPKKKYTEIILKKGGLFVNLIHPTVIIHRNTKIGTGLIMMAFSSISNECEVGNFVTFMPHSTIGHDCKVSDFCHIAYSDDIVPLILEHMVPLSRCS